MVLISESPGDDRGALGVVTLEDVIEELIGEYVQFEFLAQNDGYAPHLVAGHLAENSLEVHANIIQGNHR